MGRNDWNDYDEYYPNDEEHNFEPLDNDYEDVYDEDGEIVVCDMCPGEIKWIDKTYMCPDCERKMSRAEFFDYIGANPPGKECWTCDNLYPGCVVCLYGYCDD